MSTRDEDIHIDLTPVLMDLGVAKLVRLANLAMNRLTLRDWGEIYFDVGLETEMRFVDATPQPGDAP